MIPRESIQAVGQGPLENVIMAGGSHALQLGMFQNGNVVRILRVYQVFME